MTAARHLWSVAVRGFMEEGGPHRTRERPVGRMPHVRISAARTWRFLCFSLHFLFIVLILNIPLVLERSYFFSFLFIVFCSCSSPRFVIVLLESTALAKRGEGEGVALGGIMQALHTHAGGSC